VHVLGRALQLGERRDGGARRAGQLVVDFEKHRLVGLHNQRAVSQWPNSFSSAASSPPIIGRWPTPPT
jgi:hypothetical protein